MTDTTLTVRDLRRAWKPHKERLAGENEQHPTNVRFHRACSWLARAETAPPEDLDFVLLARWIAFNALYGQWDQAKQEPVADVECWKVFLERMLELDTAGRLALHLQNNRAYVLRVLDDKFLSRRFWRSPTLQPAGQAKSPRFAAQGWYAEQRWLQLLERFFERVYFLRCQLVHGAATYNGELNRSAIRLCAPLLDGLLKKFLQVWIEAGADEDWGIMCYPPVHEQGRPR